MSHPSLPNIRTTYYSDFAAPLTLMTLCTLCTRHACRLEAGLWTADGPTASAWAGSASGCLLHTARAGQAGSQKRGA